MTGSDHGAAASGSPRASNPAATPVVVAFLSYLPTAGATPRYVVTRRPEGVHLEGQWELPGGKVEAGEGAREALARELREELGVEVEVTDEVASCAWRYEGEPPTVVHLTAYLARVVPGSPAPRPLAASAMRLVSARELLQLPLPPANAPLLVAFRGLRPSADAGSLP